MNAYLAAHLYYERQLTQEEVANRMEVSRPTVSKLLSLASSEGIVSFSVHKPDYRDSGLQVTFMETLGLKAAVVLPGFQRSAQAREILLGQGTLELLNEQLSMLPGVRHVGIGWGRAVFAFVEAIEQSGVFLGSAAEVVPLIGGSGQGLEIFQINEMVRRVAQSLGAEARFLHAPALVTDERMREALFAEASVKPVVEAWRKLDVAVVGVGQKLNPKSRHAYIEEYLEDFALAEASVGDVCSHYFDAGGAVLSEEKNVRLVAAGLEDLRRTPLVVGIASGPEKVTALLGASRAGLVNAVVTDEQTAKGCLQLTQAA